MKRYKVGIQKDGTVKYYFIRDVETLEISLFPTKYLTHLTRANRSPPILSAEAHLPSVITWNIWMKSRWR